MKIVKRFSAALSVVAVSVFTAASLASCNLEMQKESGYTEGRYELNALTDSAVSFRSIVVDADGALNLTVSYGETYDVSYTESDQEKFSFSYDAGVFNVKLSRSVKLLSSHAKDLVVTLPRSLEAVSLTVETDGSLDCTLSGKYTSLRFDVDGVFSADFSGVASELIVDADGAASIGNSTFSVDTAKIDVDGALNIELTCNVLLSLDVDGFCSGSYYGDCRVEKQVDGLDSLTFKSTGATE